MIIRRPREGSKVGNDRLNGSPRLGLGPCSMVPSPPPVPQAFMTNQVPVRLYTFRFRHAISLKGRRPTGSLGRRAGGTRGKGFHPPAVGHLAGKAAVAGRPWFGLQWSF